jgi:hypothetical protein
MGTRVDGRPRQKFECFDVRGTDNRKVLTIQRCDLSYSESFGCCDHRCVDGPEGKVSIDSNKLRDSEPVGGKDRFGDEVPKCEITEELDFGICPETGRDEVSDFCHEGSRDEQGSRMGLQELTTRRMVAIVGVDVGEQWARVDEEGYAPTSARRISSILSEMSSRPLCPAPVARKRRVPRFVPRYASIASRVSSETVVTRRPASCLSLASRSSGSFTVVRLMYASIFDVSDSRSQQNVGSERQLKRDRDRPAVLCGPRVIPGRELDCASAAISAEASSTTQMPWSGSRARLSPGPLLTTIGGG